MNHDAGNEPLFSILLPTHNRADVLPFAIRSVLGQTVQDFELLIVGDGCTDQTAVIVKDFIDPRIQWFDLPKAPNFGYANRNIALRQARGEYVAFMAHDDLWLPDHLELLHSGLEEGGVELAYSRPLWVIREGMIAPGTFNLEHPATMKAFLAREQNLIPAGCVVHRRECFAKYGYWDEDLTFGGDRDMWIRIIQGRQKKNFAYVTEPTCLHFRANWRGDFTLDQPQFYVWKQLHALEGYIPRVLKVPVPNGMTEQESVWQAMSGNPQDWSRQVRMTIQQLLDQRVSESDELIGAFLGRQPALECDVASLIKFHAELWEHQALLKGEVADLTKLNGEQLGRQLLLERYIASLTEPLIEGTLIWKLVRGLRAIKHRTIPSGSLLEKVWLFIVRNLGHMN